MALDLTSADFSQVLSTTRPPKPDFTVLKSFLKVVARELRAASLFQRAVFAG
jgi:hypothetical protein